MTVRLRSIGRRFLAMLLCGLCVGCQYSPAFRSLPTLTTLPAPTSFSLQIAARVSPQVAPQVSLPANARLTVALFDNGATPQLGRWSAEDAALGPRQAEIIQDAQSTALGYPAPGLVRLLGTLPAPPAPLADGTEASRWWVWRGSLPTSNQGPAVRLDITDLKPDLSFGEGAMVLMAFVTDAQGSLLGRSHAWLSSADLGNSATRQLTLEVPVAPETFLSQPAKVHVAPPSAFFTAQTAVTVVGSSNIWASLGGSLTMVPHALGTDGSGDVHLISTKYIHRLDPTQGLVNRSALLANLDLVTHDLMDVVGLQDGSVILGLKRLADSKGVLVRVAADGSILGQRDTLANGDPLPWPRAMALRNGRLFFNDIFELFECDTALTEAPVSRLWNPYGCRGLAVETSGAQRLALGTFLQNGVDVLDGNFGFLLRPGGPGYVDGDQATARFGQPEGVAYHPYGYFLVADTANHAVRMLDPDLGEVGTLVDGVQTWTSMGTPLRNPFDVAVDPWNRVLVLETGGSQRLLRFE
ncbi:MAG: hypothetical protein VKO64_06480 [Candidatus Sericytochromatia bacterium]|nr:hypothetical protein [Candidatus Sericytochromatia bacterium]